MPGPAGTPVRLIGLAKLLAGSAAYAAGFWFVLTYGDEPWFDNHYRGPVAWAVVAALPGVFGLIGLIELLSGRRIRDVAARWQSITPWKRWLLSIAIIVIAMALVVAAFSSLAMLRII